MKKHISNLITITTNLIKIPTVLYIEIYFSKIYRRNEFIPTSLFVGQNLKCQNTCHPKYDLLSLF